MAGLSLRASPAAAFTAPVVDDDRGVVELDREPAIAEASGSVKTSLDLPPAALRSINRSRPLRKRTAWLARPRRPSAVTILEDGFDDQLLEAHPFGKIPPLVAVGVT